MTDPPANCDPKLFARGIITREDASLCMVEQQAYDVIDRIGKIEIRHYPKMTLATVSGREDNDAFGYLFNYIEGRNRSRTRLPMTAPVISTGSSSEKIEMTAPVISDEDSFSFVLPAEYDSMNAPEPLDDEVKLVEVPERRLAVLVFGGRATPKRVRQRTEILVNSLGRTGLEMKGTPFLMRYNSPFSLPLLRRNEVACEVTRSNPHNEGG